MTDNTELQRLTRLRRLARQITASLQAISTANKPSR
jgi:hypothetical protein